MYGYFVNILTSKTLAVPISKETKLQLISPHLFSNTHTHIYIIYINCRCSPQSRKLVSFPANGMTVKAIERPNWQRPTRPHRPHNKVCFKHSVSCCCCFFLLVLYSSFSIKFATQPLLWTACLLSFDGLLAFCFWSSSRTQINDKVPGLAWPERQRKNAPKCGKLRRRCKEKLPRGSRAGCRSKRALFLCYKLNAAVFVP